MYHSTPHTLCFCDTIYVRPHKLEFFFEYKERLQFYLNLEVYASTYYLCFH